MKVVRSVTVRVPPERAFAAFWEEIGTWWPLGEGFAFAGDRWQDMVIEGRQGGRVYERARDGELFHIGSVTTFEPPWRIVLTWGEATEEWEAPTEIEVRFTAQGPATRVELEHRGFERIGPEPGPTVAQYELGWAVVMDRFAAHGGKEAS